MNKYEMVVVLDAAVPKEEKETTIKEVGETIGKCDGQVINSQVWIDKHKFAFLMKKRVEGSYYIINFGGQSVAFGKLREALKLNEKILRFLIVRVK